MEKFIDSGIKPEIGDLVLAACMDDISTSLSRKVKHWFSDMGATDIWWTAYRQSYAFIGIYGKCGNFSEM